MEDKGTSADDVAALQSVGAGDYTPYVIFQMGWR